MRAGQRTEPSHSRLVAIARFFGVDVDYFSGGVPAEDADRLVKPKAFVVLKEGASSQGLDEALKAHVKASIGAWQYPRWIEIVDALPKTATGKIQRFKLRERGQ